MRKLTKSFNAIDTNGKIYRIDCYQEFVTSKTLSGKSATLAGMEEYWCAGSPVTPTDDQTFQIVGSNTQVKKVA